VATLTQQLMDERSECAEPHVCACSLALPRLAGPGRRARAHDMRVNGPPKSGPSPCEGATSFCRFIFCYLAVKFRAPTDRDKDLNGTRVYRFVDNVQIESRIIIGSRTRSYIRRLAANVKPIPTQVRFSPLLTTALPS
jgi:hypothetical protein